MIYNINFGTGNLEQIKVDNKNDLAIGTVLHLNGYSDPDYVIVKNMGVSDRFEAYGAKYLCVKIDDLGQAQKSAYELRFLSEKKDNRIQTYITDEVKTADEVKAIYCKSEARRIADEAYQAQLKVDRDALTQRGRDLFKKHIPEDAQALIVAEYHVNESDIQSDYFHHSVNEVVILGYSMHKKDLFKEMRTAAEKIPETAHLGPGKGHFEPRVVAGVSFYGNCSCYKGSCSHWHNELTQDAQGERLIFPTKAEAQAHIDKMGDPAAIKFDAVVVPFNWTIESVEIEHREKYSMGAGYYLKDGHSNSSGWCVSKVAKWGADWQDGHYEAMAKRCIFE